MKALAGLHIRAAAAGKTDLPFPHTRLVAYRDGAPAYPPGWVLVEPLEKW